MRSPKNSVNRWLACSMGVLAIIIALRIIAGREKQPAANAESSTTASPLNTIARSPLSTPKAGRDTAPEIDNNQAEDFTAAIKLAVQNGEELNDDRGVFALGYRWVAVDPEAALDFVLKMPIDNTLLLVALVDEWTRRDPASAAKWATRLPESARRTRVLPSLVAVWAENAPTEATRFASSLPPGETKNEAIVAATSGWARQDPRAVLEWAHQSLQGTQQEQIYTQAVFTWGQRDPVAAAEWLRSMPDGKVWDSATSALSGALVERYPALALSLATNIADQEIRDQRIENVARRWLEADRAAAEHALIQSDLPVTLVSRLLR